MQKRREPPAELKAGFGEAAGKLSETLAAANYGIKPRYVSRTEPRYFEDSIPAESGLIHQPQVYDFAGYLAERFGCTTIIDVGSGRADKLATLADRFHIVGIDYGANLDYCRRPSLRPCRCPVGSGTRPRPWRWWDHRRAVHEEPLRTTCPRAQVSNDAPRSSGITRNRDRAQSRA